MPDVHVTSRHTFKDCRRKYKYQELQRLSPKETRTDALWLGSGVHYCLAGYYRPQIRGEQPGDVLALWDQHKVVSGETPTDEDDEMVRVMLTGYVGFAAGEDDFKIIAVEFPLRVRIPGTRVTLVGTLDLLVRWRGYLWIIDHKTAKQFPGAKQLELDDQATGYLWLAHQKGLKVRGVIFNYLRKKVPTIPKKLVGGGISKNMGIDTTHDVYYNKVIQEGYDPDDYKEVLETLKNRPSVFFHREPIARNLKELDQLGRDLVHEVRDMTSKKTHFYPNPTFRCSWCAYQVLCKAEQEGSDVVHIQDAMYRVREDFER